MSALLGYEKAAGDEEVAERVWVAAPGSHCVASSCKDELLAAIHELKPPQGARLVLLGTDVAGLAEPERLALLGRVGFVASDGGLISSLNCWENISLPVAYHAPAKLAGTLERVHELLDDLGGVEDNLLAKLPEDMTLYERRLAAFVRAMLESPELLLAENLDAGLGPTKRRRVARFADVYHQRCPGGTFVQLEEARRIRDE
jgi:ABC-type transporter Mla maintaining outer membrane lipid asymmetry ATPase subunit MlaF